MRTPRRSTIRSMLALALVVVFVLVLLAALARPGAGFEALLPPLAGAVALAARWYFGRAQG